MKKIGERSSYIQMLNSITSDLDLLVTDICDYYPREGTHSACDLSCCHGDGQVATYHQQVIKEATLVQCTNDLSLSNSDDDDEEEDGRRPTGDVRQIDHVPYDSCSTSQLADMSKFSDTGQSRMSLREGYREITLLERLNKTHTIWLLANIGRPGAVHLLKDLPTGSFLVRQSSVQNTLALSVQTKIQNQSTVDHYIIEKTDHGLRLQGSHRYFKNIPTLIAHYIQNLDELPHKLILPSVILNAKTSQELSALAMLGQDFWTSMKSRISYEQEVVPLHKSCSEPINITHPHSAAPWWHTPNLSSIPSHSVSHFPHFTKHNSCQTVTEFTGHKPVVPPKFKSSENGVIFPGDEDFTHQKPVVPPKFKSFCSENRVASPDCEDYEHSEFINHKPAVPPKIKSSRSENGVVPAGYEDYQHPRENPSVPPKNGVISLGYEDYEHTEEGYKRDKGVDSRSLDMDSGVDMSKHTYDQSKTHPPYVKRNKPSLYFSTSLDMVNQDTTYFKSSLSDKLSDYEDIWKNSVSETDGVRTGLCKRLNHHLSKDSGIPDRNVSMNRYVEKCDSNEDSFIPGRNVSMKRYVEKCDSNEDSGIPDRNVTNVSMKRCAEKREVVHENFGIPDTNFSNVSTKRCERDKSKLNHTNVSPKGKLVIKKDDEEEVEYAVSKKCKTKPKPSHASANINVTTETKKTKFLKTVRKTDLKIFRSELSTVLRKKPPSLSNLSRIKSSSTSSLTNLKSPVYAEPVDSVKFSGKSAASVRIRRLSAPSGPTKIPEKKVSRHPNLETILSPRQMAEEQEMFFTFGQGEGHRVTEVKVTRSQSLRAGDEIVCESDKGKKFLLNNNDPDFHELETEGGDVGANQGLDAIFNVEDIESVAPSSSPLSKFPIYNPHLTEAESSHRVSCCSDSTTVQDLISGTLPELSVRPLAPPVLKNVKRQSEYDNLSPYGAGQGPRAPSSVGTVFCKPWDNSLIDALLSETNKIPVPSMDPKEKIVQWQRSNQRFVSDDQNCESDTQTSVILNGNSDCSTSQSKKSKLNHSSVKVDGGDVSDGLRDGGTTEDDEDVLISGDDEEDADMFITPALRERMQPIVSHASGQATLTKGPGAKIRDYIYRMSKDKSLTFGCTIENFIKCTLDGQETNPHIVMRNVRQFMSGIKNYLIKHGEGELTDMIERERSKLGSSEILNIDTLIEGALHVCVIRPLKHYIYRLFVHHYSKNGNLKWMSENIKYARNKSPEEIGIKAGLSPPSESDMEMVKHHLDKMQQTYSPVRKLENLLAATSTIYHCVQGKKPIPYRGPASLGADDFLPMLIYILVHSGMVSAEIEADYMWGLLHPTLQTGEGGYYLTTFSSAALVLRNFKQTHETSCVHASRLPSISDMQGFLKIALPDEVKDSITWKTLPVRPNMLTKEVCGMIAHKFKITNSQEYGLYLLVQGTESILTDNMCPQMVKTENLSKGVECYFAYKRKAANIAWPKNMKKQPRLKES